VTFASIALPAASVRWRLDGPPGAHLDAVTSGLVGAGVGVAPITPGTAYRLNGSAALLEALAAELAPLAADGWKLGHEMPPPLGTVDMRTAVKPAATPRRSFSVHGVGAAASYVARAIDLGLQVESVGINRWLVTASTGRLVQWLAAAWQRTPDEVLLSLGWTAESLAAEDDPSMPVSMPPLQVSVVLPERRTISEIVRDAEGEITSVTQIETTTQP
jgi:hypothetical protein